MVVDGGNTGDYAVSVEEHAGAGWRNNICHDRIYLRVKNHDE
jgi:hypothetical protein